MNAQAFNGLPRIMILFVLCLPAAAMAAQHNDKWCADATLFSLHTVKTYDSQKTAANNVDTSYVGLKQQYPALSEGDMQKLVKDAYSQQRSPFAAARAAIASCNAVRHAKLDTSQTAAFSGSHSEKWCAEMLDFAIGTAGYREMGQSKAISEVSVKGSANYYQKVYPALNPKDLNNVIGAVFDNNWSRFDAARAVTGTCKVNNGA